VSIRKLVSVVPVIAVLALAAPVANAGAQTAGPSAIPCYPEPAFCGPNGQPWFPLFQFQPLTLPSLTLPSPINFGPGPVQLPGR
jgi:hypothetical protein